MQLGAWQPSGLSNASSLFEMKNRLLAVVAAAEALTGLALLVLPSLVGRLLLGAEVAGAAIPAARVAGIALMGLSIACLPGRALLSMLTYSTLVTVYLGYIAICGEWVGILLWPAVVLHAVLSLLLARAWFKPHKDASS
jgi:hypothetical protein